MHSQRPTPKRHSQGSTACLGTWFGTLAVGSALELGIWSLGFDEIAMKYRYSKFRPEDLDGLDLEELLSKLSDLLLQSGFDNPYGSPVRRPGGGLRRSAARRDPGSAAEWRADVGRDAGEAARQGLADGRRCRGADRAAGAADPAEAAASGLPDRPARHASPAAPSATGRAAAAAGPSRTSGSRSPTRAWTSSAIVRCAICSARSAAAASAGTTRARWRPASRPAARRSSTSSATR